MKLKISRGRIIGIEDPSLKPILPNSDLSFVEDKDLYKEIRNYLKSEHRNLKNELIFQDEVMKGSSTYLAVAVDMFLKKYHPGFRIARHTDLETNLSMFKGFYIDSGLALRNLKGANKEQGIYLFNQLKQRGIKEKNFPIWLDLRGLLLDQNLNFNLTDESRYKTEECLSWECGIGYSKIDDFGLPQQKDKNSGRQIWTSDYSLSRCYLVRISYLYSSDSVFSYSNDIGRVVLAKARSA